MIRHSEDVYKQCDCKACPYTRKIVRGLGSSKPKILIIGECPTNEEAQSRRPLVGQDGALLRSALTSAGLSLEDVWFSHAILCRPTSKRKEDLDKARQCCKPQVDEVLQHWPDVPVWAIGDKAVRSVLPDETLTINDLAGTYATTANDRPVVMSRSMFYVRSGGVTTEIEHWFQLYDLLKLKAISEGTARIFTDDIKIATTKQTAIDLMRRLARTVTQTGRWALDLETRGVNGKSALQQPWAAITAYGFATEGLGISIPGACVSVEWFDIVRSLLANPSIELYMHNRLYDEPVLRWRGFDIQNQIHCTMLRHHAQFPGLSHNLQRVTAQFSLTRPWKSEFRKEREEYEDLLRYNARDTLATIRNVQAMDEDVYADDRVRAIYDLDNRMAEIACKMHLHGIPISLQVNRALVAKYKPELEKIEASFTGFWKPEDVDLWEEVIETKTKKGKVRKKTIKRATVKQDTKLYSFLKHLALQQAQGKRKADPVDFRARVELRYEELLNEIAKGKFEIKPGSRLHMASWLLMQGVPLSSTTGSGGLSTKAEILEAFAEYQCVRDLLKHREYSKLYTSFIREMPNLVRWDGTIHRLHPSYSVNKISGRWSTTPATQNWPLDMRVQVEPLPGKVIIGADFAQLEARIIALLSKDAFLLDIFADRSNDLHSIVAASIFPTFDTLPKDERKKVRDLTKSLEYGAFYGAQVEKLHAVMLQNGHNVSRKQAGRMLELINTRMAGVVAWHQELQVQADRNHYVESGLLRRRRYFPTGNIDMNIVYNFPVQATGADIMNLGLDAVEKALPEGACPILQIHDAVYVECREDQAQEVKDIIEQNLYRRITQDGATVEFLAEAKIGRNWKEVS